MSGEERIELKLLVGRLLDKAIFYSGKFEAADKARDTAGKHAASEGMHAYTDAAKELDNLIDKLS